MISATSSANGSCMSQSKVDLESLMQSYSSSVLVCVCGSETILCQGKQFDSSANTGPFDVSGNVIMGQGKLKLSSSYTGPFEVQSQCCYKTLCCVNLQTAYYEAITAMCYEPIVFLFVILCFCSSSGGLGLSELISVFSNVKWIVQLHGC